ncbi:MAG: histidine kinase [Candidatus Krumholzibacteriota bacterium]|nr:histidine kinase [Candidatus Krumholzibacteriota bacterium]
MKAQTEVENAPAVLRLLSEARAEADELRKRLERDERVLLSTRMIMGHELKRPATAIRGYLDLALEQSDPGLTRDVVDAIKRARDECGLLDELGSFFLRLLKVDRRRVDGHSEIVRPGECVSALLGRLPRELRPRDRVSVTIAPDAASFRADADAVAIILENVIENALMYSDPKSPVEVSVERTPDKRGAGLADLLKIRVADHGPGIPEEMINRVFKPFVRLRQDVGRGAGLGLTLVRSLAELHGGSVYIRSEEGVGTRLYVTIPELPETDGGAVLS